MPNKKTSKGDKRQPLPKPHLPASNTALPSVQTETKHADARNSADHSKEKEKMPAILTQSPFSLWMQTWLPIILSGLILIAIIVQAYIYKKQWGAMLTQGSLMDQALQQAEETGKMENRAYVGVIRVQMREPLIQAVNITVDAVILNTGNTPAKDVETAIYAGWVKDIPKGPGVITTPGQADKTVIMPGVQVVIGTGLPKPAPNEYLKFVELGAQFYVWGTIKYVDMFGERHSTTFCFVNADSRTTEFWSCARGNDFD